MVVFFNRAPEQMSCNKAALPALGWVTTDWYDGGGMSEADGGGGGGAGGGAGGRVTGGGDGIVDTEFFPMGGGSDDFLFLFVFAVPFTVSF